MIDFQNIGAPNDLDWKLWIDRWDSMQRRYLVKRTERFTVITNMIKGTQKKISKIIDLGCGPGSLMATVLEYFPNVEVIGIDFDPTLLLLANIRLMPFGHRAKIEYLDLREPSWTKVSTEPVNAIISATALHWFSPAQLVELYSQIAKLLRKGGIFLNADHVGSDSPYIQKVWEKNRERMRIEEAYTNGDDWSSYWKEYSKALRIDIEEMHRNIWGGWGGGVEQGLPLTWHFDILREKGFSHVDCFWRCDCDAIYGGIKL